MPLILDTELLPPAERTERFVEVLGATSGSSTVEPDLVRGAPTGLIRFTETGRSALFTNRSSSTRISLSPKEGAAGDDVAVAVAIQLEGTAVRRSSAFGERLERPGDVFVVDRRRGFDVRWTGVGHSAAFLVPRDALGLSLAAEDVAAAAIRSSPLYPLVRRHMAELVRLPDTVLQGPAGRDLDEATVRLVQALLASTQGEVSFARETSESTLMTLVRSFVRQHVHEPDLSAARIALAVNVSRRSLYRLFARQPVSLQQYVISERLDAARHELEVGNPLTPVATIAYRYAFKDPRHFSRRFKAQYGMTPHDFRAQLGAQRQPS